MHGLASMCVYEGIFLATSGQSRQQVYMQKCSPVSIDFAHAMLRLAVTAIFHALNKMMILIVLDLA
jgi:hypothetical protein